MIIWLAISCPIVCNRLIARILKPVSLTGMRYRLLQISVSNLLYCAAMKVQVQSRSPNGMNRTYLQRFTLRTKLTASRKWMNRQLHTNVLNHQTDIMRMLSIRRIWRLGCHRLSRNVAVCYHVHRRIQVAICGTGPWPYKMPKNKIANVVYLQQTLSHPQTASRSPWLPTAPAPHLALSTAASPGSAFITMYSCFVPSA